MGNGQLVPLIFPNISTLECFHQGLSSTVTLFTTLDISLWKTTYAKSVRIKEELLPVEAVSSVEWPCNLAALVSRAGSI